VRGLLYESNSAARCDVEVAVLPAGNLQVRAGRDVQSWLLADLSVEPRLAGVPAVAVLPDGRRLEVLDADAFYGALGGGRMRWVHALEAHWGLALLCTAVSIGLVAWFVMYGIPLAARVTADLMPDEVHDLIGREGMDAMDRYLFESSQLPAERQAQLLGVFADVVSVIGSDHDYDLQFRRSEAFGPNAVALPAGIVVLTDELVALAEDDAEIAAVLAHEVGHVVHRHAMRRLVQTSVSAGLIVAITGDDPTGGASPSQRQRSLPSATSRATIAPRSLASPLVPPKCAKHRSPHTRGDPACPKYGKLRSNSLE